MNIILWADLQCPFCYAGETNLQNAIRELGLEDQIQIDIKTYQIHRPEDGHGEKPLVQIFQDKEGFSREDAQKQAQSINDMLKNEANIDMDFGQVHESVDLDAHRLYKFACDKGRGETVRDLLHKAYFHDHVILEDRDVLLKIAEEAGLDAAEAGEMLETDLYTREIRNDEMEAAALGIESVPYFIVGTEVVPEHLTKEEMMKVLQRNLQAENAQKYSFPLPLCTSDRQGQKGQLSKTAQKGSSTRMNPFIFCLADRTELIFSDKNALQMIHFMLDSYSRYSGQLFSLEHPAGRAVFHNDVQKPSGGAAAFMTQASFLKVDFVFPFDQHRIHHCQCRSVMLNNTDDSGIFTDHIGGHAVAVRSVVNSGLYFFVVLFQGFLQFPGDGGIFLLRFPGLGRQNVQIPADLNHNFSLLL